MAAQAFHSRSQCPVMLKGPKKAWARPAYLIQGGGSFFAVRTSWAAVCDVCVTQLHGDGSAGGGGDLCNRTCSRASAHSHVWELSLVRLLAGIRES